MTFRSPSGVLAQPLQRQAHSGTFAALAAAFKRLRARTSARLTMSPVSASWLSDHKRQSKRYSDY